MNLESKCPLCHSHAGLFYKKKEKRYYQCAHCLSIFVDPRCYVSKEDEKKRYQEHNNDIENPNYQKFVAPIINEVERRFGKEHRGLDFGAGTGPVIAKLLGEKKYVIDLYDPFFWNNPEKLEEKYDYIVCCEVMEHFHFPDKEFALLKSLLKPGGVLFCMTDIYSEEIDFKTWYYKDDITHVFFYHRNAIEWIHSKFKFSGLKTKGRIIQFLV